MQPTMNIIFDFGGVLGLPQDRQRLEEIHRLCGMPFDELYRLYQAGRSDLDRGTVSGAGYWRSILSAGRVEPTADLLAHLTREDALSWTRLNEPMLAWAEELRVAGHRTAILSNMPTDTLAFMRQRRAFDWINRFSVTVFSCELKLLKPEAAIFRVCMEKLAARPETCIFIDDILENVEAAAALGMGVIHFQTANQAGLQASRTWGLPVRSLLESIQS